MIYYDLIYSWKNYAAESADVVRWVKERNPSAVTLLDVACGTGKHLEHLASSGGLQVEGVDLDAEGNLEAARKRLGSKVPLHAGNMIDFNLHRTFDVITCLFSSIGYVGTVDHLRATIANFARHLAPGGVLIVEPWFSPEEYKIGQITSRFVDEPDIKIARFSVGAVRDGKSILDFHYMVATKDGVEEFRELHELALFSVADYTEAFALAGLSVQYDKGMGWGRGMYIAVKPRMMMAQRDV